jgi:hypothetical protein
MRRTTRGATKGEVRAYDNARTDHDQTQCGGTWRAHTDPQERLDCIKTSDQRR